MFPSDADNRPGMSPVVLIVDDIGINRQVATLLGRQLGWDVSSVGSGAEALSWLALHRAALVLMDVHMPDVDGITTTRLLRSGGQVLQPDVPVMFVTADAQHETHARCLDAGGHGVVYKPLTLEKLEQAAKPLLQAPTRVTTPPPRALIADPDERQRRGLRAMLEQRGMVVDATAAVDGAVDHARRTVYDLVFIASTLDGVTLARQLRFGPGRDARVIVLSADGKADVRVGADAVLTAPFEATALGEALRRAGWTHRATRPTEGV